MGPKKRSDDYWAASIALDRLFDMLFLLSLVSEEAYNHAQNRLLDSKHLEKYTRHLRKISNALIKERYQDKVETSNYR